MTNTRRTLLLSILLLLLGAGGYYLYSKGRPSADVAVLPDTGTLRKGSQIASGGNFSIVLDENGDVWTWGRNDYGQLADGTTTDRSTKQKVAGLPKMTAIAAGKFHGVGIDTSKKVWTWGNNEYGALGDNSISLRSTPYQIPGLENITTIVANQDFSLALDTLGNVYSWGSNGSGELGNGTLDQANLVPQRINGLTNIKQLAVGYYHALAVDGAGKLYGWGNNEENQLTNPHSGVDFVAFDTPTEITGLPAPIKAVAAGDVHSVVLLTDGTVWTWGNNLYGQIGNNTTDETTGVGTPTRVLFPENQKVVEVGAGAYQTIAITADEQFWVWGDNWYGQLGDGTYTDQTVPIKLFGLPGDAKIVALDLSANGESDGNDYFEFGHSIALLADGSLLTWGNNLYGELGLGNACDCDSPTPQKVPDFQVFTGAAVPVPTIEPTSLGILPGASVPKKSLPASGGTLDLSVQVFDSKSTVVEVTASLLLATDGNLGDFEKLSPAADDLGSIGFWTGTMTIPKNTSTSAQTYQLSYTAKNALGGSVTSPPIDVVLAASSGPKVTAGSSSPAKHDTPKGGPTTVSSCWDDPAGIASVILEFASPDGSKPTLELYPIVGQPGCFSRPANLPYNTGTSQAKYIFTQVATNTLGVVTRSATSEIFVAANTPTEYISGKGYPCGYPNALSWFDSGGGDFCIATQIKDPDTIDYLEMEFKRPDGTYAYAKFGKESQGRGPDSGDWTNGTWTGTASIPKHSSLDNPSKPKKDEVYKLTMIAYDKTGAKTRSGTSDVTVSHLDGM